MTTANWLTILAAVISAAVTYGTLRTTLAAVREQIGELKAEFNRSRQSVGERLEQQGGRLTRLETRDEVVSEYSRPYQVGRRPLGEPPERG
jgi:hypothetical protein